MSRQYTYYGSFQSAAYFTDLFGVPAAAYSLRKLSPNSVYSGAAIRVRRSSDNTEQDINFVSSSPNAEIDTVALLSFVGSGNGFVTTWYNQGSGASDAIQTTAANQPKIVNSGSLYLVNSKPSIQGGQAGSSIDLNITSITQATQSTFAVFEILTTNTSATSALSFMSTSDGNIAHGLANNGAGTAPHVNFGTPLYYKNGTLLSSPTRTTIWNNFIINQQVLATTIGGGTANTTRRMQYPVTSVRNNQFNQEILIYSVDKSLDKTAIETDINDYYNVF